MDALEVIREQVENNPVIIYMKGSPEMPSCGFSSRAAQALMACNVPFAYVNVLENPEIFHSLPQFANWPTFPQIYVDGELVGGCDITIELFQNGELKTMMEGAAAKAKPEDGSESADS